MCFESIKAEASSASPRTRAGAANSRKNRSHVVPTLIPTLLIKEGRAARGSRIRDPDQRRSLPHRGSARIANIHHICTMHHVQCLRYSGLLFGTGQRIGCLAVQERGQKSNNEEEGGQGGNCPGATRLHYELGQTSRLRLQDRADEQGLAVRACCLCCVIPRSHRQTSPCSHIHTHAHSHFGRVRCWT